LLGARSRLLATGEEVGENKLSWLFPNVNAAEEPEAVGEVAPAEGGGGLEALAPPGVGIGGVPELNSAHRGHLRFVFMCPI